jgi:hypothetical protein
MRVARVAQRQGRELLAKSGGRRVKGNCLADVRAASLRAKDSLLGDDDLARAAPRVA